LGLKVLKVLLESKGHKVLLGLKVLKVLLGLKVLLESKGHKVLLGLKVLLESKVLLVNRVQ
jgi:hypothetical protein